MLVCCNGLGFNSTTLGHLGKGCVNIIDRRPGHAVTIGRTINQDECPHFVESR